MAARNPRYAYRNELAKDATVLSGPAQAGFPVTNLKGSLRSQVWRSPIGWVVDATNNKINVDEGGVDRTATIASGTYPTGALYAAAVQTALNAMAGAVNTYTCTYNTTTKKFTIARATGAATVTLEWLTGANEGESAGVDLGFFVTADDTGATSYTGDEVSYQSRKRLLIDLGDESCDIDIITGENDTVDFSEAGNARVATVAGGHYSTLADLAAAAQVAMNGATGITNTYTVTWTSLPGDQMFRFTRASGADAFAIQWATGPNVAKSIGPHMGYDVSDDTGSTEYASDDQVFGWPQISVAILSDHNMRFQGTATVTTTPVLNTAVLSGADGLRLAFLSASIPTQSWVLIIDDVQNVDGLTECRFWLGTYEELSRDVSAGTWEEGLGSLDTVHLADHGAHLGDERPKPWSASGAFQQLTPADRETLETIFQHVGLVRPWWYFGDPENAPREGRYVVLREPFRFAADPEKEDRFSTTLGLEEDLP